MKTTNFFKAVAVMAIAVLSTTAYAQNSESDNVSDSARVDVQGQVINQIKKGKVHYEFVGTAKEAYDYLKAAPADTLVTTPVEIHTDTMVTRCGHIFELTAQDTLCVSLRYSLDGPRSIKRDTLCILNQHITEEIPVMSETEKKVRRLAKETQVISKVNSGRDRQMNGYRVSFDNGNEYIISEKEQNTYGWQIGAYTGGEFGGVTGFTAGGRLGYTHKWLSGTIDLGLGTNKYEANAEAEYAGTQMFTFESRAMGWFNLMPLFKADTYNQWRLEIGGGGGFKGFKTKSREVENPDGSVDLVQSEGNGFGWVTGIKGTWQPFNKGYSFSLEGGVSQTPNVWQDQGQKNHLTYYVRFAMTFDCWRNKVNHK